MQVVLLEDLKHARFGPLTLLRPEFDLRCGALELREKLEMRRPDWNVTLCPRPSLAALVSERHPARGTDTLLDEPTLLLYGRVIADEPLLRAVEELDGEALLTSASETVGAVLQNGARERIEQVSVAAEGVGALGLETTVEIPARTVRYPWELVAATAGEIAADARFVAELGEVKVELHHCARLLGEENISVGEGSEIGPSVVLDAREGPVVIGRDVRIMASAVIIGPAFVGDGSVVRACSAVYGGTSIGPVCKVGGEIQASVLQSFSNKQHGGFLGHSFVGSWVNIGAATNNSDLKNNYGNVRVELAGEIVDTGSASVGAIIGDHSKTAIGTTLNTGTVVGIFCSVFASGFPPKSIPSFSWGTPHGFVRYDLKEALDTASRVMARRGEVMTHALRERVTRLFGDTS
ncbi:MAG: putative sugar nucleotidyl transferase [Candidatus Eisenbacteria bacterium]|nr:putative sugar nucleotidyl transferase [Candidatus Eisenbacteria bacterium]